MERRVLFVLTICSVIICQGWSIQVNRDLNRRKDTGVKIGKNKRDYPVSGHLGHSQSPSPVNYYQNSGGFDLKPPASPWSNQFYPPTNYQSNQFYQPNSQVQQNNLASLLAKCTERNLYYCKELFAKQLVQHVREMVTYRNGMDPYLLSAILGTFPSLEAWKTPFTRTEIRTETDLLDNEITHYEPQIHQVSLPRPEKGHSYQTHSQWNPSSWYNGYSPKPAVQEQPFYKPQEPSIPGNFYPKPYFKVPQSVEYFKPASAGINYNDPPLSFPYNNGVQDGFRESKEYPVNVHHRPKVCNPCAPSSTQNLIDIRNKTPEQQDSKNDNSTIPTSRA